MKSLFVLAAVAASAVAQRLSIASPTAGETVASGSSYTVELHQDVRTSCLASNVLTDVIAFCYDCSKHRASSSKCLW